MHVFNLTKFNQKLPPNPIWLVFIFTTFFDSAWVNFTFVLHVLTCYTRCSKKRSSGRKNEGFSNAVFLTCSQGFSGEISEARSFLTTRL